MFSIHADVLTHFINARDSKNQFNFFFLSHSSHLISNATSYYVTLLALTFQNIHRTREVRLKNSSQNKCNQSNNNYRIPNWISIRRRPPGLYIHMRLVIVAEDTIWARFVTRTELWNSELDLCDSLSHLINRVNIVSSLWSEIWSLHSSLSKELSIMWS